MSGALVMIGIGAGLVIADIALSHVKPKALGGLACVPFGTSKPFKAHSTHFVEEIPRQRPDSYRHSAAQRPRRVAPVAFPEVITGRNARLIPLEDGMSAMLVTESPFTSGATTIRIDAIVGPEPDRFRLRARITPFSILIGVVVPAVLVLGFGPYVLLVAGVMPVAFIAVMVNAQRALTWAFDTTERRLRKRRRGVTVEDENGEDPHVGVKKPATLPARRKRVLLDAEEGKETAITVEVPELPPVRVPRS